MRRPIVYKHGAEPYISIITGIHGDETAPVRALQSIDDFLRSNPPRRGLQLIVSNPGAIEKQKRFINEDLNRCFPGNHYGQNENKLAAEILELTKESGYVFDFHTCPFEIIPYAVMSGYTQEKDQMCRALNIEHVLVERFDALISYVKNGVGIECGYEKEDSTVEKAFEMMKAAIEYYCNNDGRLLDNVNYYTPKGTIDKNGLSDYKQHLKNFKLVRKGQKIGVLNGKDVFAEDDFYPLWVDHESTINKLKKMNHHEKP